MTTRCFAWPTVRESSLTTPCTCCLRSRIWPSLLQPLLAGACDKTWSVQLILAWAENDATSRLVSHFFFFFQFSCFFFLVFVCSFVRLFVCFEKREQKFHSDDYPVWVVILIHHQYGITGLVLKTSFRVETSFFRIRKSDILCSWNIVKFLTFV